MSGLEVVFAGLALLAVISGLLAVTSLRVVHCALWLVVCLGCLAGCYLVLGAEVVALVQLLVYVGAVVVLVLFALMLTRAPTAASKQLDAPPLQRAAAALAGLGVAVVVGGALLVAVGDETVTVDADRGSPTAIGTAIFAGWVFPFELLSVLLLAALVAALAISRDPEPSRPGRGRATARDARRGLDAGPTAGSGARTDPTSDAATTESPAPERRRDADLPGGERVRS